MHIDETCTSADMVRECGRSPRGVRLIDYASEGHLKAITFVAALHEIGMTAPGVIDGAVGSAGRPMILGYVDQILVPPLERDDIVIVDSVREAIEATRAHRFRLPPYSPDLNPIEHAFSTLKALLRKASGRASPGCRSLPPHRLAEMYARAGVELNLPSVRARLDQYAPPEPSHSLARPEGVSSGRLPHIHASAGCPLRMIPNKPLLLKRRRSGRKGSASQTKET